MRLRCLLTSNLFQELENAELHQKHKVLDLRNQASYIRNLRPCDFFFGDILKRRVNSTSHPNISSLKALISENLDCLDQAMIGNACQQFRTRLEKVVKAQGSYIK